MEPEIEGEKIDVGMILVNRPWSGEVSRLLMRAQMIHVADAAWSIFSVDAPASAKVESIKKKDGSLQITFIFENDNTESMTIPAQDWKMVAKDQMRVMAERFFTHATMH